MAKQEQGMTTTAVRNAAAELEKMKSSLRGWLKYRELNDAVLAGTARTKLPPGIAKKFVEQSRDPAVEAELANRLHVLLTELMPGQPLPPAQGYGAAVQLAKIALAGGATPAPMGGILSATGHPWLWPVLIVGGLLLAVTTAVKTAADVAKERERYACIQAGACTDYGFWLKAGGITVLAWFAWKELGVGDAVRGALKKRRS